MSAVLRFSCINNPYYEGAVATKGRIAVGKSKKLRTAATILDEASPSPNGFFARVVLGVVQQSLGVASGRVPKTDSTRIVL
jgi:hypothetical protein